MGASVGSGGLEFGLKQNEARADSDWLRTQKRKITTSNASQSL